MIASNTTRETKSTCCYCGVGCGVVIESVGDNITGVRGDATHPANFGKLCTKGTTLALTMQPNAMTGRARFPEMRLNRETQRERVTWDAAQQHIADKIVAVVREHGADAIGVYVSGQLLTEDYYAFNKFTKGLLGTNNIDTNSRLCMSSAVTGYTHTLGVDAPPCSYEDIDHATTIFIAGSNTAFAHPILFRRIEAAKENNPALKIIVVDPRRTETADIADLYLPILPGTDVALFHAMLHVMLWEEWVNRDYTAAHTEGLDALRAVIREMSPAVAADICGVPADDIITAARWFATSPATLSLYCQGLNQSTSGTAKNASLINLHLVTAQIGKPGAGPFSLTGQPNAMGGREVGGLATTLAAHRDIGNAEDREEVRAFWNAARISDKRGLTAVEMFAAAKRGEIKVLWIVCTNPAQSLPNLNEVRAALETAELVIVQDAYRNTETAAFADVILPATSWGEKEGTVTNSERRISRVRAPRGACGEAKHDWQIACEIGRRVQAQISPNTAPMLDFDYPEQLWNEHRALTRGRDLDITGMSYAMLEDDGPQQWPLPEGASVGAVRLYADAKFHTASGRAKLFAAKYQPVADKVDAHYPLRLTTGRLRDQWHGMSRTGALARLYGSAPEPRLAMNPHDLLRRNFRDGELVKVQSRRGAIYVRVESSESLRSGQVYLPMHWGKRFLGGANSAGVNTLTNAAFDAYSRQPELKHAAVKIVPAQLSWQLTAFCLCDGDENSRLDLLQTLQRDVAFMSATLIGRDAPGILIRAAHHGAPTAAWLAALDQILSLESEQTLRYDDVKRGSARRLLIVDDRLIAVRLSGDEIATESGDWLSAWLLSQKSVRDIRRLLLSPSTTMPIGATMPSRMVCQCIGVAESAICAVLANIDGTVAMRLGALQSQLRCGTECGSCLPELKMLVAKNKCTQTLSTTSPQVEAA
jgi:assimilatory nitrate reductase catalytic subunit